MLDGTVAGTVGLVVMHNDFDFSNLVLSGPVGHVVGVWDFSCVELGHPASDLRYLADESVELAGRVAAHYTELTGRALDLRDAVIAGQLERIADALSDERPDLDAQAVELETLVARWGTPAVTGRLLDVLTDRRGEVRSSAHPTAAGDAAGAGAGDRRRHPGPARPARPRRR